MGAAPESCGRAAGGSTEAVTAVAEAGERRGTTRGGAGAPRPRPPAPPAARWRAPWRLGPRRRRGGGAVWRGRHRAVWGGRCPLTGSRRCFCWMGKPRPEESSGTRVRIQPTRVTHSKATRWFVRDMADLRAVRFWPRSPADARRSLVRRVGAPGARIPLPCS